MNTFVDKLLKTKNYPSKPNSSQIHPLHLPLHTHSTLSLLSSPHPPLSFFPRLSPVCVAQAVLQVGCKVRLTSRTHITEENGLSQQTANASYSLLIACSHLPLSTLGFLSNSISHSLMHVVTAAASSSHVYELMFWKTVPLSHPSPLDTADLSDSSSIKTQRLLGGHDMDVPLRAEYYPSSSLHVCQLRVSIVMSSAAAKKKRKLLW